MIPYFFTPIFFGLSILLIVFEMSGNSSPEIDNIAMGTYSVIFVMLLLGGLVLLYSGGRERVNKKIQQILGTHGPYPITDSINKQIKYYYTHLGDKKPVTLCKNFYDDIFGEATCEFCSQQDIIDYLDLIKNSGDSYYSRKVGSKIM